MEASKIVGAFMQHNLYGVVLASVDGEILEANARMHTLLQVPEGSLAGTSLLDITHPDDHTETRAMAEALRSGSIEHFSIEKRYVNPSGAQFLSQTFVTPIFDDEGAVEAMLGTIQKIEKNTPATQVSTDLDHFFTMSLDLLCIAGMDGYFKKINPAFVAELGHSEEELLSKSFLDFIHPDDVEPTMREVEKLGEGVPTIYFENRYRCADGSYKWFAWTSSPDPKAGIMYAVAHNVSALKEANLQLDQFAYIVSHDLKAPLRGIHSLTTFLEEDLADHLTETTRKNFELLKGRVKRMEGLINGILEYSRVVRSDHEVELVDINKLLEDLLDSMEDQAGVVCNIAPNLPAIKGNRLLLHQVFQNLLSNAIKHSNKADTLVEIGAKSSASEHMIWIQDNGPGIAPEYHDKIFRVFQTLQSRDHLEGTGIGLSIVKQIVEQKLSGRIRLESKLGEGARFVLSFPRAD